MGHFNDIQWPGLYQPETEALAPGNTIPAAQAKADRTGTTQLELQLQVRDDHGLRFRPVAVHYDPDGEEPAAQFGEWGEFGDALQWLDDQSMGHGLSALLHNEHGHRLPFRRHYGSDLEVMHLLRYCNRVGVDPSAVLEYVEYEYGRYHMAIRPEAMA